MNDAEKAGNITNVNEQNTNNSAAPIQHPKQHEVPKKQEHHYFCDGHLPFCPKCNKKDVCAAYVKQGNGKDGAVVLCIACNTPYRAVNGATLLPVIQ